MSKPRNLETDQYHLAVVTALIAIALSEKNATAEDLRSIAMNALDWHHAKPDKQPAGV